MTLDVYRGLKTTMQQQQQQIAYGNNREYTNDWDRTSGTWFYDSWIKFGTRLYWLSFLQMASVLPLHVLYSAGHSQN